GPGRTAPVPRRASSLLSDGPAEEAPRRLLRGADKTPDSSVAQRGIRRRCVPAPLPPAVTVSSFASRRGTPPSKARQRFQESQTGPLAAPSVRDPVTAPVEAGRSGRPFPPDSGSPPNSPAAAVIAAADRRGRPDGVAVIASTDDPVRGDAEPADKADERDRGRRREPPV